MSEEILLKLMPTEHGAIVANELAKLIPSLANVPGKKVWACEYALELPNKVRVSIHSWKVHGYPSARGRESRPLEQVRIVYESDFYNNYKNKDALRRGVKFSHNGEHSAHGATEVTLNITTLREKLSEVMEFAEANENRLADRRSSLTAGEHHAEQARKHFGDLLVAAGIEDFKPAPDSACIDLKHDTREDFDRPAKIILRLSDEDAVKVIGFIRTLA